MRKAKGSKKLVAESMELSVRAHTCGQEALCAEVGGRQVPEYTENTGGASSTF